MLKILYAIGEAAMHITTLCTPTAQWHHFSAPRTRTTCGVVPLRAQHIGNHDFALVVSTCGARQRLRVASASSRCEQRDRWVRWNHGSCNGTILAPAAHVLARNAQNGSRWPANCVFHRIGSPASFRLISMCSTRTASSYAAKLNGPHSAAASVRAPLKNNSVEL